MVLIQIKKYFKKTKNFILLNLWEPWTIYTIIWFRGGPRDVGAPLMWAHRMHKPKCGTAKLLGTLPNWGSIDAFQNKSEWCLQVDEKTKWVLKNFQQFFKKKKSVRDKEGGVKCWLNRKDVCDLSVQKAFCVFITGVRKWFPPGGVVALLCYVDSQGNAKSWVSKHWSFVSVA